MAHSSQRFQFTADWAPKQGGMAQGNAEEKQFLTGRRQQTSKAVKSRKQQAAVTASLFLSLLF